MAIVSYEGDETISKVSPLGQRVESRPENASKQAGQRALKSDVQAVVGLGAAVTDIGIEMPRPSRSMRERLGGPGRRIRWLVWAGRTVIAQISAGGRY